MRNEQILILSRYFVKRLVVKMCSGLIESRSEPVFDAGSTIDYKKVPCCPKFFSFLGT